MTGETRRRSTALAMALEVDTALLMRLALDRLVGATVAKAIAGIFGAPATRNERGWLFRVHDTSNNGDPCTTQVRALRSGGQRVA